MTDQNNKNLSLEGIELYPLGKFTEDAYPSLAVPN